MNRQDVWTESNLHPVTVVGIVSSFYLAWPDKRMSDFDPSHSLTVLNIRMFTQTNKLDTKLSCMRSKVSEP